MATAISGCIETEDVAALERAVWAPGAVREVQAGDLQSVQRKTHHARFRLRSSGETCAARRSRDRAGARARRMARSRSIRATCTLCMACVGACPEGGAARCQGPPQLKFIERNCVQCGLCEKTCPEKAISLAPRLLLDPQAKAEVVLNEAEPFNCVRCGKPFGTRQMIDKHAGAAQYAFHVRHAPFRCRACRCAPTAG